MMQPSNSEGSADPLARFLAELAAEGTKRQGHLDARKAIEPAMQGTFHEGIKFAAEFFEGEGRMELAGKLRARVRQRSFSEKEEHLESPIYS